MANNKELKNHINSVRDTQKITNAMYLIASTKLQKAKNELEHTKPYFVEIREEVKRIFRKAKEADSIYFYPDTNEVDYPGTYGLLVITADKGLAGAYNMNVIKEAARLMKEHKDVKLYVVGEYGRHYFESHNIPIEKSFLYTAQNPSLHRARDIAALLLEEYRKRNLVKLFVIYTDYQKGIGGGEAVSNRILPLRRDNKVEVRHLNEAEPHFMFRPSVQVILDNMMPSYVAGFVYSALVSSFCCEQNARMTAMDSANQNAEKLLDDLYLQYNYVRQGAITQEITEISSGAKALERKNK